MFTHIKFYINSFCTSQVNTIILGRWKIKNNSLRKEIISSFYANSDNCGDKICGDVVNNKKLLDNSIKNDACSTKRYY
jgi:hypothetical protein